MQIENRQANTLFGVVSLFILGNSLRIILNIDEAVNEYNTVTFILPFP
jgi:hypothetical protein